MLVHSCIHFPSVHACMGFEFLICAAGDWQKLKFVCLPEIESQDGSVALFTTYINRDGSPVDDDRHILGFQSRQDAIELRGLLHANRTDINDTVNLTAMAPKDLQRAADKLGAKVTVFKPQELWLLPGMTMDNIGQAISLLEVPEQKGGKRFTRRL